MPNTPVIPETVRVHLGAPDSNAPNVTVSFPDYIKNVASSEIYPTWPESALRANILAQISFALNRIYTEYYPSLGYDFDITNNTGIDQSFVNGRDIFENISRLVDEIFKRVVCSTCASRNIGSEPSALFENCRIAAHEVAVLAAVVLVDQADDLLNGGIGQRIDVVYVLDVDIHHGVAGELFEYILKCRNL